MGERILSDDTAMGVVTLRVADLDVMSDYYANAFAMEPLEERVAGRELRRVLGRGTVPLVRLIHTPDLPAGDRHQAGLFHTAFLFHTPANLAATVYRAAQDPRSRFIGSSDHLVSEAFYFTDPEGNGVELYADRPREQWVRSGNQIAMATEYLDPSQYLRQHLTDEAIDDAVVLPGTVGHVHLQVGDIAVAREFYVDALGFETTQSGYPGALFASAGGYHHHIAMNVWNSRGAGPRAATIGLGDISIVVPDRAELDALESRLRARNIAFAGDGRSLSVRDPWDTNVTVTLPERTTDELLVG